MRFKGTLVLFLVFAVLGGYVYFTEFRGKEERQKQEAEKKKLFGGEARDITELTLEYADLNITGARKDNGWQVTSPSGLEADSEAWDQLASNFVQIEKDETVSAQKTDLAPYGLDKPLIRVVAKLRSGSSQGVFFGVENPKKTFNYAKRTDQDEVFLSATSWAGLFKKTLTDLRDKKILDFQAENIDSFRIAVPGNPEMEFQRLGMDWSLKKPIEARAEGGEISSFLSSVQFGRASAFADAAVDVKAAGLEAPAAIVTLHDIKANADRVVRFGKSPEKDKYYAKDDARSPILILGMEIWAKTQQPVFTWRDKSIARFDSPLVDEVELVRGSEKVILKKAASGWQASDGRKLQEGKLTRMVSSVENERVLDIVDAPKPLSAYGLDKPRLEVTFRQAGKELASVKLGAENKAPAGVYVKAGSSPAVMTAARDLYDTLNVQLSDLLEPPPAPEAQSK